MTYQSINFSIFPQVLSVLAVVFCGGVFALFMYFLYDKRFANVKNKDKINKAFIVLLIISAVILLVAIFTDGIVKNDNRKKAAANIIAKYNIEKVILNDYRSGAYGDGSTKRNDPTFLVLVNGEEHVYRYEVNRETSEPTLKDVEQHSGRQTTPGPLAETLVKAKTS